MQYSGMSISNPSPGVTLVFDRIDPSSGAGFYGLLNFTWTGTILAAEYNPYDTAMWDSPYIGTYLTVSVYSGPLSKTVDLVPLSVSWAPVLIQPHTSNTVSTTFERSGTILLPYEYLVGAGTFHVGFSMYGSASSSNGGTNVNMNVTSTLNYDYLVPDETKTWSLMLIGLVSCLGFARLRSHVASESKGQNEMLS